MPRAWVDEVREGLKGVALAPEKSHRVGRRQVALVTRYRYGVESKKLQTKDLIATGIFTAIYFVTMAVCGQLGALIPILQVLGPLYIPIICGIPFILFLTRVRVFGQIAIMGIVTGLLLILTGQHWAGLVLAVVLAPLGDWIAARGGYKSWWGIVAGYAVFSELLIGMVVPLFFTRQTVLERIGTRHDQAWVQQVADLTPPWMFLVMILMIVVGSAIGAYVGRVLLKKHFERAGIA
ncbi:MAG: MptD family putative ECF transporter S component [Propionibacteriaceae bacterium]|jgi:energy-coupling factor transport system substrate-specific component|nr:MptD family putative ECF transporter S component [Propionibacteriaceae bacterium]